MICNIGINDMPKGWIKKNEWNKRRYYTWKSMITRCYSGKYKTYEDCYVCERWLKLSNFIEDLPKINGYKLWKDNPNQRIALDKDIKSDGKNKCYCLEECMFVTIADNNRQSDKTMSYDFMQTEEYKRKLSESLKGREFSDEHRKNISNAKIGKPNINSSLIARYNKQGYLIDIKYQFEYIHQYGFVSQNIYACCVGRNKTSKGFVFKYLSDVPEEDILNYIRHNMQVKIKEE